MEKLKEQMSKLAAASREAEQDEEDIRNGKKRSKLSTADMKKIEDKKMDDEDHKNKKKPLY